MERMWDGGHGVESRLGCITTAFGASVSVCKGKAASRRFQAATCLEHMLFMSEFLSLEIHWCKTGLL